MVVTPKEQSVTNGFRIVVNLRRQVDEMLLKRRREIEEQMEKISALAGERAGRSRWGRGSTLRGRKVAPKYRGPSGETWAGGGDQRGKEARRFSDR
jgi:hypothetical protein